MSYNRQLSFSDIYTIADYKIISKLQNNLGLVKVI